MDRTFALRDEQVTQQLGALLARGIPWHLSGERSVYLSGALGAGKTTLTAALLAAWGVRERVRSPTYALLETYPLEQRLGVHVDLYRLLDPAELEALGLRDYLQTGTLLLVEWPERGAGELPVPDLWIYLTPAQPGRHCRIEAHSAAGAAWLAALPEELPSSGGV